MPNWCSVSILATLPDTSSVEKCSQFFKNKTNGINYREDTDDVDHKNNIYCSFGESRWELDDMDVKTIVDRLKEFGCAYAKFESYEPSLYIYDVYTFADDKINVKSLNPEDWPDCDDEDVDDACDHVYEACRRLLSEKGVTEEMR